MSDSIGSEDRSFDRTIAAVRALDLGRPSGSEVEHMAEMARLLDPNVDRRSRSHRRLGLRLAGIGVAAAAVLGAIALAPGLGGPNILPPIQSAYAAVKTAAAQTAAAASSGTIDTHVQSNSEDTTRVDESFTWNGDDLSLSQNGHLLFVLVDHRFYGYDDKSGVWTHFAGLDQDQDGQAMKEIRGWIDSAKSGFGADLIGELSQSLGGLTKTAGDDGSSIYTGTIPEKAVSGTFPDSIPAVAQAIPTGDPDKPVTLKIEVGPDGLIRSWTCTYDFGTDVWGFTCTYRGLGSTPVIPTPDPSKVIESTFSKTK